METVFLDIPSETPLLDSLIYLGIILLILSQITEKITTYIRNYIGVINPPNGKWIHEIEPATRLQNTTRWLLTKIAALDDVSDLAKRKSRTVAGNEKNEVDFAITKLSIFIGFFVAFLCKANMIELLNSDQLPHTLLGWQHVHLDLCNWKSWRYFLEIITGCFMTGFLLTFGSKFFHDLLELLYEVKRLRRKTADEYTYRAPDIETLMQRIESRFDDPVKKVLERHKDHLMKQFPNLSSVARIFDAEGNSVLEICVKDQNLEELKKYEFDYLEDGLVKKLHKDGFKILWKTNTAFAKPLAGNLNMSGVVCNKNTLNNQGSISFFAKKVMGNPDVAVPVMVTCFHVLRTPKHDWSLRDTDDPDDNRVSVSMQGFMTEVGSMISGLINPSMDCAVVKIYEGYQIENTDINFSNAFSEIDTTPMISEMKVEIKGAVSASAKGIARSCENAIRIDYVDKIWEINDLLYIINPSDTTQNSDQPGDTTASIALAKPGDSGAIVVDENRNAIGMVIAADRERTYAIPIRRIVKSFQLV